MLPFYRLERICVEDQAEGRADSGHCPAGAGEPAGAAHGIAAAPDAGFEHAGCHLAAQVTVGGQDDARGESVVFRAVHRDARVRQDPVHQGKHVGFGSGQAGLQNDFQRVGGVTGVAHVVPLRAGGIGMSFLSAVDAGERLVLGKVGQRRTADHTVDHVLVFLVHE